MIDLGKKLNSAQMITLTQIFTQQPRNTVSPQAFNSSHFSNLCRSSLTPSPCLIVKRHPETPNLAAFSNANFKERTRRSLLEEWLLVVRAPFPLVAMHLSAPLDRALLTPVAPSRTELNWSISLRILELGINPRLATHLQQLLNPLPLQRRPKLRSPMHPLLPLLPLVAPVASSFRMAKMHRL